MMRQLLFFYILNLDTRICSNCGLSLGVTLFGTVSQAQTNMRILDG